MDAKDRVSTLGYALLGLLARGEGSGYELAQGLKEPVSFFWSAQHSHVYPELAKLEAAGLVQFREVAQQGKPNKKVYQIQAQGLAALSAWSTRSGPIPGPRDELMLKVYSMWLSDPVAAVELLGQHETYHHGWLERGEATLEEIRREVGEAWRDPHSPHFARYAVVMRGVGHARAYRDWCRWLIETLEQNPAGDRTGKP